MRLEILGSISDTSKDLVFQSKLDDAYSVILNRVYPYTEQIYDENIVLTDKLMNWQTRCAIELYNRLGDEGLTSYSENGLSYSYKTDFISEELLRELPPTRMGVIF